MDTNQSQVPSTNVFLKGFLTRLGYGFIVIPFVIFEDCLDSHPHIHYKIACATIAVLFYLAICVVGGINDKTRTEEEQKKLSEKSTFTTEERMFIAGQRKYIGSQKWIVICSFVLIIGLLLKTPIGAWTRVDAFNFALMMGFFGMWYGGYYTSKKWIRIVDKLMK